ncbi:hypothetical protein PAXRUDRAFT_169842, partial [Paxillus rubicundulus Ve08.2h10]
PLSTYKRKDDLVALAGTLSLPMEGTVAELTKAIKDHLAANPSRMNDPRFSALFSSSRKHSVAVPDHATQQQQAPFVDPSPSSYLPSGPTVEFPQHPLYKHHHPFPSSYSNPIPHVHTRSPPQMSYNAPGPSTTYTYKPYHENQINYFGPNTYTCSLA